MKMTAKSRIATGFALVALVAGCDKSKEKPSGQVVATVDGEDITIHELNSELALARAPADAPRKTVEQVVLGRVIERKMLANVARERGLDKNPAFLLAERRVDEGLLVQALQADIAKKVPPATREAAEKYIEGHPDQFAQRKIFVIDQIQFPRPGNIDSIPLAPAKTLDDVVQVLNNAKIDYRRSSAAIDALTVNPLLTDQIKKIVARDPNEVFMFADQPQGAPAPVMFVNKVVDTKISPFTGEQAITFAQQFLQRQAVQNALLENLKKFDAAAKPKISYAAGYGPPSALKTPAAAGTPAPATAPAGSPAPAIAATSATTS